MRNNETIPKYSTKNNVPISKFILDNVEDILKNIKAEDIYQYPNHNFKFNFLKIQPYINFGVDGIIRDIFLVYSDKKIYYNIKNYRMVDVYAKYFNMKYVKYTEADIIYISNPNNVTLRKISNKYIKEMIKDTSKKFIIDLSYDIYNYKSVEDFFSFANEITQENTFVLFGLSKMLGLPGTRVGFCLTLNDIFNDFHQPWQVTSISKIIIDKLFNVKTIQKHVDIINNSKEIFKTKLNVQFKGDGPFLGLRSKGVEFERFSIIDYNLYKDIHDRHKKI